MKEDTLEVSRTMRAASPPASASDLLDTQNERRNMRPLRRVSIFSSVFLFVAILSKY